MGAVWARRITACMVLTGCLGVAAFGQARSHLTGNVVVGFDRQPSTIRGVETFTTANQPLYWGGGFEVLRRHIGVGGLYTVNFDHSGSSDWWLDWYGEAVYLSYHLFGRHPVVDPFASVGLGSAGRVWLGAAQAPNDATVLLSIFPVVSMGLGIDLGGLYLGGKLSYLPVNSTPPVSPYGTVPLGRFQFSAGAGTSFGW